MYTRYAGTKYCTCTYFSGMYLYLCPSNVMFKIKVSHPHLDKAPSLTNYGYGVKTPHSHNLFRPEYGVHMYNYIGYDFIWRSPRIHPPTPSPRLYQIHSNPSYVPLYCTYITSHPRPPKIKRESPFFFFFLSFLSLPKYPLLIFICALYSTYPYMYMCIHMYVHVIRPFVNKIARKNTKHVRRGGCNSIWYIRMLLIVSYD